MPGEGGFHRMVSGEIEGMPDMPGKGGRAGKRKDGKGK